MAVIIGVHAIGEQRVQGHAAFLCLLDEQLINGCGTLAVTTIVQARMLQTDRTISELMGKDVGARFRMITENAAEIGDLDV